jgi:DNA-binding NarL/FixJ family response regulator
MAAGDRGRRPGFPVDTPWPGRGDASAVTNDLELIRRFLDQAAEASRSNDSPRSSGRATATLVGQFGQFELDQLPPREREVLLLIARGYTYKVVGRDLTISGTTVESHVSSVLRKLQLSTRHELTKWATDRHLV